METSLNSKQVSTFFYHVCMHIETLHIGMSIVCVYMCGCVHVCVCVCVCGWVYDVLGAFI